MSYARHSVETMREARARLKAGEGIRPVARSLGLPVSTVQRWARDVEPIQGELSTAPAAAMIEEEEAAAAGSMIEEALSIEAAEGWEKFGRSHPLPGFFTKAQSGRVFGAVASGLPIGQAFEAAGGVAGDLEVIESRAKTKGSRYEQWAGALKICAGWQQVLCAQRVYEGLAGWPGARSMLAKTAPRYWGEPEEREAAGGNQLEGVSDAVLIAIVREQFAEMDAKAAGKPRPLHVSPPVVVPLHATGMDDEKEKN